MAEPRGHGDRVCGLLVAGFRSVDVSARVGGVAVEAAERGRAGGEASGGSGGEEEAEMIGGGAVYIFKLSMRAYYNEDSSSV